MSPKVEKLIENMDDEHKAILAAEVLADISDPNKLNIESFLNAVKAENETLFGELCSRAAAMDE